MKRIAILGGGIAGLAAAYELETRRREGERIEWDLYEASERLGGTVQTTRHSTAEGEWILEGGPDAWVTEKPWARELAEALGLGEEVIPSNDAGKKTYIWIDGALVPMPDRMRMMVPEDLATLETSPLFSMQAKAAYAQERERAEELKASIPPGDEPVSSFVCRHFGQEVLEKIGAPLLSGVFGGDVAKLSVRAVMPAFVRMETEHGSLVKALEQGHRERDGKPAQPLFTTLRRGMGSLAEAIVAALPPERLHTRVAARQISRHQTGQQTGEWGVRLEEQGGGAPCATGLVASDHVLLATPVEVTRGLLQAVDAEAASLLPIHASSAVLTNFCWPAETAAGFDLPAGFGFLVPQDGILEEGCPKLLAGTFTTQKFNGRAPGGARVLRIFFGGAMADALDGETNEEISATAWRELLLVLPGLPLPEASLTTVARWPRSLPQYEVGHGDRMKQLRARVEALGRLTLLGNGYHGVGVPDIIREARSAARALLDS